MNRNGFLYHMVLIKFYEYKLLFSLIWKAERQKQKHRGEEKRGEREVLIIPFQTPTEPELRQADAGSQNSNWSLTWVTGSKPLKDHLQPPRMHHQAAGSEQGIQDTNQCTAGGCELIGRQCSRLHPPTRLVTEHTILEAALVQGRLLNGLPRCLQGNFTSVSFTPKHIPFSLKYLDLALERHSRRGCESGLFSLLLSQSKHCTCCQELGDNTHVKLFIHITTSLLLGFWSCFLLWRGFFRLLPNCPLTHALLTSILTAYLCTFLYQGLKVFSRIRNAASGTISFLCFLLFWLVCLVTLSPTQ